MDRGAIEEARRLHKPSIPETGCYGIAIRDEIVLARALCHGAVTEGGARRGGKPPGHAGEKGARPEPAEPGSCRPRDGKPQRGGATA